MWDKLDATSWGPEEEEEKITTKQTIVQNITLTECYGSHCRIEWLMAFSSDFSLEFCIQIKMENVNRSTTQNVLQNILFCKRVTYISEHLLFWDEEKDRNEENDTGETRDRSIGKNN